jgi:hypothetical protein
MSSQSFQFATDTATLCVFDLAALRHRFNDVPDWWVWPHSEQIEELNAGHAAFLDLGTDGVYSSTLSSTPLPTWQIQVSLHCPSGQIFIGAAEEATADGLEPDCTRGGLLLNVPSGVFQLRANKLQSGLLAFSLCLHQGGIQNNFTEPLRLSSR